MRNTTDDTLIPELAAATSWFRGFWRSERGSWTVEAVIWTPIYLMLTAVAVNVSMVFHNESQILHAMQNVARAHSLNRYETDADALAALNDQLDFLNAPYTAAAVIDGPLVRVTVDITPSNLMPMGFLTAPFDGFELNLIAEQLEEI